MGIIRQKRKAETRALLLQAGLGVFAERGIEFATLDDIAQTAGFTKGAIYRQFPSKGAFLLALFEQYAAVARSGTGARQASWFIPLTLQFAAHAMRDPLLRRRFAVVLAEAPDGGTPDGQLLKALGRVLPPARSEEHTSELQSQSNLVCRLLLEKKKKTSEIMRQIFTQNRKTGH